MSTATWTATTCSSTCSAPRMASRCPIRRSTTWSSGFDAALGRLRSALAAHDRHPGAVRRRAGRDGVQAARTFLGHHHPCRLRPLHRRGCPPGVGAGRLVRHIAGALVNAATTTPGTHRAAALNTLIAAVRPEFRGDQLVFPPADPVFGGSVCRVASCDRTARGRGMCSGHLQRWEGQISLEIARHAVGEGGCAYAKGRRGPGGFRPCHQFAGVGCQILQGRDRKTRRLQGADCRHHRRATTPHRASRRIRLSATTSCTRRAAGRSTTSRARATATHGRSGPCFQAP